MIILFKQRKFNAAQSNTANLFGEANRAPSGNSYQPIVILDYTRSDEQWTTNQINTYVSLFAPEGTRFSLPVIYSLDYSMTYTHRGINYGDSLKTEFVATVKNPPSELVTALNIQQYVSQQNVEALNRAISNVIDPQILFPSGGFVVKGLNKETVARKVIVYSTPYSFDPQRVNSTLILRGANFDSMVMRLGFAVDIDKTKPLFNQLLLLLTSYGFNLVYGPSGARLPAVSKYYAPATVESLLRELCFDNNLAFDISNKTITIQDLSPNVKPKEKIKYSYSFQNYVANTNLISTYNPENYASSVWESSVSDIQLFTSVAIYNDSGSNDLFANLSKIPGADINKISAYRFYVQEYTIMDGREKTSIMIKGSNNWLISTFKLDTLLESKVYLSNQGQFK